LESDPREIICELCRQLYDHGWASGSGGGVSLRRDGRVYMAPGGVQNERLRPEDLFVLDEEGAVIEAPAAPGLKLSACAPLFFHAFRLRGAGAVIHSHSVNAMLATLLSEDAFRVTHLEMMKGLVGVGFHDDLVVPIIENTAHEHDLAGSMAAAMEAHPQTHAVLVRRHGVYVWGADWAEAKTQAECYDYLFEAAVKMRQLGIDPARRPEPSGLGDKPRVTH
jgi:methylthioribulose-1-phosphate dehydratase